MSDKVLRYAAAILGLSIFAGAHARAATPTIYYSYDNSEVSGNTVTAETGQAGTISATGVTTGQAPTTGFPGQSFSFSGGNVTVPAAAAGTGAAFTIDMFINPSASPAAQQYITQLNGSTYQQAVLYNFTTTNAVQFYDQQHGGILSAVNMAAAPGVWSNIAYTYDGTTLTGYENGSVVGSTAISGIAQNWASLVIGSSDSGNPYGGGIDNFRIYGTALSAQDIASLNSVPEPASLSLLAVGTAGLLARRRRAKA